MRFVLLLLALAMLSSCHLGSSRSSPTNSQSAPAPAKTRGTTARAQKWMQTSIDLDLAREQRQEHPPSGRQTWRNYWQWRISLWHKDKSSRQYEQYLARRRKELGLPSVNRL